MWSIIYCSINLWNWPNWTFSNFSISKYSFDKPKISSLFEITWHKTSLDFNLLSHVLHAYKSLSNKLTSVFNPSTTVTYLCSSNCSTKHLQLQRLQTAHIQYEPSWIAFMNIAILKGSLVSFFLSLLLLVLFSKCNYFFWTVLCWFNRSLFIRFSTLTKYVWIWFLCCI